MQNFTFLGSSVNVNITEEIKRRKMLANCILFKLSRVLRLKFMWWSINSGSKDSHNTSSNIWGRVLNVFARKVLQIMRKKRVGSTRCTKHKHRQLRPKTASTLVSTHLADNAPHKNDACRQAKTEKESVWLGCIIWRVNIESIRQQQITWGIPCELNTAPRHRLFRSTTYIFGQLQNLLPNHKHPTDNFFRSTKIWGELQIFLINYTR